MRRKALLIASCVLCLAGCQPPPAQPATTPPDAATSQPEQTDATADASKPAAEVEEPEVSQENLPAAEDMLAKAVAALGGQEKIESIKTFYAEAETVIPQQNITSVAKTWWKDGRSYVEQEMPQVGVFKVWTTPDGVWSEDPINGLRKLEGQELAQARWGESLVLVADWEKYFDAAQTKGRRKKDDKTLIDVELTSESGANLKIAFDEESGLPLEQSFVQVSPNGNMPLTVYIQEYEEVDGLKREKKTVTDMTLLEATTTMKSFEAGAKVPDKKLLPPKGKTK